MTMLLLIWNPRLTFNDTRKKIWICVVVYEIAVAITSLLKTITGPLKKMKMLKIFFAWLCRYNDPTFYEKKSHFTIPLYVKQNWISNPKVSKNLSIQPTLVFINLQETCNWVDSSLNDKKRNWQMEITLWNLLKVYRRQ